MRFTELALAGAYAIDIDPHRDARGFFARTWSADELAEHGLSTQLAQCSISFNERRGTIRGMHFQEAPYQEIKLVRCTAGAIVDVILDLRPASLTFTKWVSVELTAANHRSLYIPAGLAHGFQTIAEGSEVFYQISTSHRPDAARGVRWNDPTFQIEWPDPDSPILSERDRGYPDFRPEIARDTR
jgi:dTDP-4-dehydrorhamnose 3,5-epimerase